MFVTTEILRKIRTKSYSATEITYGTKTNKDNTLRQNKYYFKTLVQLLSILKVFVELINKLYSILCLPKLGYTAPNFHTFYDKENVFFLTFSLITKRADKAKLWFGFLHPCIYRLMKFLCDSML